MAFRPPQSAALLALGSSAILAGTAQAQVSIARSAIAGGGGTVSAGGFTLSGTIGQPVSGPVAAGGLELHAGFWARGAAPSCNDADIAPPFGILDLADISAFTSGFLARNPVADLNTDGIFDLADISAFTATFLDGCP